MVNQPNLKKGLPILRDKAVVSDAFCDPIELREQFIVFNKVRKYLRKPDFPHQVFFVRRMFPGELEQADKTLGELDRVSHFQQQIDPSKQLDVLGINLRITSFERLVPLNSHIKSRLSSCSNLPLLTIQGHISCGDQALSDWGTSHFFKLPL
jgi:hypothetical protein